MGGMFVEWSRRMVFLERIIVLSLSCVFYCIFDVVNVRRRRWEQATGA